MIAVILNDKLKKMEEQVTKEHLEERIVDWKKRISDLYGQINIWTNNSNFTFKIGGQIQMYEWLMSEYDIPPTNLDTADILLNGKYILSIKPKGLWIIGANGRIDILTLKKSFILTDISESFSPPQWKIFLDNRTKGEDFNQDYLFKILNSL